MSLESFRKKFPQYDDIPDVELAEKLYDKYYSDLDETQYYSKMFPKIAKEKYDEADDVIVGPDDAFQGTTELDFISFKPTTADIAKQAGVSVNDPASSKARLAASLGYDQNQKAIAIKKVLSDQFKTDIDVRVGPRTGELEYFNPKTQEYALVDTPGFDMGDFADLGGDAMVIVPDIAATVAGTIFTGPVGGIGAGAIAAGAGE